MIRFVQATKRYAGGREARRNLSLEIPDGEFLALMGPSGSGKSTLLNLIGGLDRPSQGTDEVGGERIDRLAQPTRSGRG